MQKQISLVETATDVGGTHPTGMHSCFVHFYIKIFIFSVKFAQITQEHACMSLKGLAMTIIFSSISFYFIVYISMIYIRGEKC